MGWGTFLVLILIIIGAIMTFCIWNITKFIVIVAAAIPALVFVILYSWPKEEEDTGEVTNTFDDPNSFFIPSIGFCFALTTLFFLIGAFFEAYATVFRFVYARREDTARLENKFARTKNIDSDDEEDDAFEINEYDLEESESEEDSYVDGMRIDSNINSLDDGDRLLDERE